MRGMCARCFGVKDRCPELPISEKWPGKYQNMDIFLCVDVMGLDLETANFTVTFVTLGRSSSSFCN